MKPTNRMVNLLFWGIIPLLVWALTSGQGNAAQEYQFYDLSTLGGPQSEAFGINYNGWVVGDAETDSGAVHAFLKKPNSGMEDLGTLPGGNFSRAYALNDGGWVVGDAETDSGAVHAFLKKPDLAGMEDLGTLPGGTYSQAWGINDSGWVVGEAQTASGDYHAFLKKPGADMEDLNNLVQLPEGVVLEGAQAINDDGYIVGYTRETSTQLSHAFLLKPNTNSVKPVADAGTSQSLALWETVTLNGTGSYDPNGLDLVSYNWSFDTVPAGSSWADTVLTSATPSFLPDLCGTYVIRLVVNNGYVDSDPSTVTVQVTLTSQSVIWSIQNLQAKISDLKPMVFKNANNQKALLNKLNAVIGNIDAGNYVDALNQLQQDILGKLTGNNCWITEPSAQSQIYGSLTTIIEELMALQ